MASADDDRPVSPVEALDAFRPTLGRAGVALAVSGGADSLSLLHLWADARALEPRLPRARVFTVDHGLRPRAAAEARFVGEVAAARGLGHRTLVWDGPKPAGNLQAEARAARRRLLFAAMRTEGLDTLLLAHHADDQAETFLLRLARGSGVVGLAAMAARRDEDGLVVLRPFLDLPKARLVATLTARGQIWIEDPSNGDARFDRAKMRRAMPMLAELGLDRDRLVATAAAMARAAAALDRDLDDLIGRAVAIHPAGFLRIEAATLAGAAEEIRLRFLARAIEVLGGGAHGPRLAALAALDRDLCEPSTLPLVRTLGGVRIERRRGRLWMAPEAGRGGRALLRPGGRVRLGGRVFRLASTAPAALWIAPLGAAGRQALTARGGLSRARLGSPAPSAALLEGLAAVFSVGGAIVACPGLETGEGTRPVGLSVAPPTLLAGDDPVTNSS